ncbi:MAG TPA: M48 family metalloprotease [Candidatus Angelobacter sp.]|nr:M48 family metalloprotease [Candidatus Angelobacter sp.]
MRFALKNLALFATLTFALAAFAKDSDRASAKVAVPAAPVDPATARIFAREAKLVESMHKFAPLVETYIQTLQTDQDLGLVPQEDKYFLGRMVLGEKGVTNISFDDKQEAEKKKRGFFAKMLPHFGSFFTIKYLPQGFMEMVYLDDFNEQNYELKPLRQQFLGEVRTLVFEVVPRPHVKGPHFVGRIWVEDQDYNIVRLNGTFEPSHGTQFYFHFDSWRMNMQPDLWLPAYIYTEETNQNLGRLKKLTMKAQTRLWGYDIKRSGSSSEFTTMQVESTSKDIADSSGAGANEAVPVQSQHMWEREAEDNVLDRMVRAGILAPEGEVSKVMQTVINNLEITNNLSNEPEVRCRVLLTAPLESFTIGHTIVVSRGLLDVLPDESSLALVLAHELGNIELGHRVNTQYAFSDRMIFTDEAIFRKFKLAQTDADELAADQKGLEYLQNSPYKDKLAQAGLFLRSLEEHSKNLPSLLNTHYGTALAKGNLVQRMPQVEQTAPQLEVRNISQIPALPLGSRIKLDPWDDHIELQKSKPGQILSIRDKMSFEVTPTFLNLVRYKTEKPESSDLATKSAK